MYIDNILIFKPAVMALGSWCTENKPDSVPSAKAKEKVIHKTCFYSTSISVRLLSAKSLLFPPNAKSLKNTDLPFFQNVF